MLVRYNRSALQKGVAQTHTKKTQ